MIRHSVVEHGFTIVKAVLTPAECLGFIDELGPVGGAGRRGLLEQPSVRQLAGSDRMLDLVRPHLSGPPRAVRGIYFDKAPEANWLVAWHQDLTLAVTERKDVAGFGPWSVKQGVAHVQPPVELLEQMLTLRLHLDDCDEANGALRVLPGSHRHGRLASESIRELRRHEHEFCCCLAAGDALVMRPLLLHASGRSQSPRHRRILHIEYAGFDLPSGLAWKERVEKVQT